MDDGSRGRARRDAHHCLFVIGHEDTTRERHPAPFHVGSCARATPLRSSSRPARRDVFRRRLLLRAENCWSPSHIIEI